MKIFDVYDLEGQWLATFRHEYEARRYIAHKPKPFRFLYRAVDLPEEPDDGNTDQAASVPAPS